MSDLHDPELDAFVELLRGATPSATTIQTARANVMADAAVPATGGTLAILGQLGVLAALLVILATSVVVVTGAHTPVPVALSMPELANLPLPLPLPLPELATEPEPEPEPEPATTPAPEHATTPAPTPTPAPPPARDRTHRPIVSLDVPAAPIVTVAGPSDTFTEALHDYEANRWAEAATKLEDVRVGRTEDGPEQIAQAEFFLAKCLYHLELFTASAAAFEVVTRRGEDHPWFDESLPYVAMLSAHLPEPSLLFETIGRYDSARIDAAPEGHREELRWLLGRQLYEQGRFDDAAQILARVPRAHARFYEGLSHVRRHRATPALAAFRHVAETSPRRTQEYELAWLSIARLHYSLASRPTGGERASRRHLAQAIAAWRHIPIESSRWLDAFFEETWAHYLADDHARALGHVHTLQSPELRRHSNPEALVIRAMIQLEHCQWRSAEQTVTSFHQSYDPMLAAAEHAQRMASTNEDAFRVLRAVRARRSRVPTEVRPAVHRALAGSEVDRHVAAVRAIEAERILLDGMHSDAMHTLGPEIAARITTELAIQHSLAVDRAGELTATRLRRLSGDLRERMVQMDTVEVELSTLRRRELAHTSEGEHEAEGGDRIVAYQDGHVWPFDGEYWPDEMPHYAQRIRDRCGY